jgi:hypothetical protein
MESDQKAAETGEFRLVIGVVLAIGFLLPLLVYGTVSPCGILKKEILRQAASDSVRRPTSGIEAAGSVIGTALGGALIDRTVDAMSPFRCAIGYFRVLGGRSFGNLGRSRTDASVRAESETLSDTLRDWDAVFPKAGWRVEESSNSDGPRALWLTLDAQTPVRMGNGPVSLVLVCMNDRTEVSINWREGVGPRPRIALTVGETPTHTSTWSAKGQTTYYPANHVALINQLLGVTELRAVLKESDGGLEPARFALAGLDEAILPLRKACHW